MNKESTGTAKSHGGKRAGSGRPREGKEMRQCNIRIPKELWEKLEAKRKEKGISRNAFLTQLIEKFIEKN